MKPGADLCDVGHRHQKQSRQHMWSILRWHRVWNESRCFQSESVLGSRFPSCRWVLSTSRWGIYEALLMYWASSGSRPGPVVSWLLQRVWSYSCSIGCCPGTWIPAVDQQCFHLLLLGLDWIEQGLTSPPTQYRLSGRQFYRLLLLWMVLARS